MNFIKLKTLSLSLVASVALVANAHAGIFGWTSDYSNVRVGTSEVDGGPHTSGRPGIGVTTATYPRMRAIIDFQGLQVRAPADANGVSTVDMGTSMPSDHTNLGVFHFAKVGSANLYFGEWSQTSSVADGTHSVYFVGDDGGTTTVPSTGTATYAIKGISDYTNNGLLTGTFTANFGASTLTGSMANASSGYGVNIGTAYIIGAAYVGIGGTATQSGSTVASNGFVSGRFFNANAAALAGIVQFANRKYNAAFGGTKN